jgi:PAS domain-containing protein
LAAEALRESERQFRLFAQAVTDYALIRLDAHGVVSGWNAGAQRIKGYAEHEIVGKHFSCFYTVADRAAGAPSGLSRRPGYPGPIRPKAGVSARMAPCSSPAL